jgi:hypothetical protein
MGSFRRPRVFTPLDLEVLDRVYEAAWEQVKARDLYRDTSKDQKSANRRYEGCSSCSLSPARWTLTYSTTGC